MSRPLAIDLYCGLGGWTDGLLAEGWDVIGFDIERHEYVGPEMPEADGSKGTRPREKRGWTQGCAVSLGLEGAEKRPDTVLYRYPAQLVIQDVLTLDGAQFRDADLIIASPPCQFFSYTAMPWSKAKALAKAVRADPARLEKELALFNACFRIQREACEAAGRHIPLIVENVRGAQPWVGRARWNFGSYYLWGDVPALMPPTFKAHKVPSFRFDGSGQSFQTASVRRTDPGKGARFTSRDCGDESIKQGGDWFNAEQPLISRLTSSKSPKRKFASAMIAKIPLPLSRYIAAVYRPEHLNSERAAA